MSNALQDAVRATAPRLAAFFSDEIEKSRATIESRLADDAVAVDHLRDTIKAGIPPTGVIAKMFAAEADAALGVFAAEAIEQAGGAAAAMIGLAQIEIDDLAKRLGS